MEHPAEILPTPVRLNADSKYTGKGVTIAFIDSGFYPHPDLALPRNRILKFVNVTSEKAGDDSFTRPHNTSWHGTMTSVCAAGNGYLSDGVYRGIACDANVVLIKASNALGKIEDYNIYRGIEWAIRYKERYRIRIINISLGADIEISHQTSRINLSVERAVQSGMVVVVAVGNVGAGPNNRVMPPASAPAAITVGGLDDKSSLNKEEATLYGSSYGPTIDNLQKPEIIALAIRIAVPVLPDTPEFEEARLIDALNKTPDDQLPERLATSFEALHFTRELLTMPIATMRQAIYYRRLERKLIAAHYQHGDGTSFAAPIVASVVAQILEANPKLNPEDVRDILIKTAERLPGVSAVQQGYGVIKPHRAVEEALRTVPRERPQREEFE